MLDQLRRQIQTLIEELLADAEKLRKALFALGSRDDGASESPSTPPSRAAERARSAPASRIETGRPSASTTLPELANAGELSNAAGGYQPARVEPTYRFYFQTEGHAATGGFVANLPELEGELAICDPGVLRHHCPTHDFSHWVADVFHDEPLAAATAAAEAIVHGDSPNEVVEQARLALIAALRARDPING